MRNFAYVIKKMLEITQGQKLVGVWGLDKNEFAVVCVSWCFCERLLTKAKYVLKQ